MRALLAAVLAGALLAAGLTACSQEKPAASSSPATDEAADTAEPAPPPQASPIALRIPSIGLDTRQWQVVGAAPDGTMEVPPVTRPEVVGWYCPLWRDTSGVDCGAPVPGEVGPAVIAAHISGPSADGRPGGKRGAFARLSEVKVGQRIEVDRSDGYTATFKVTTSKIVPKTKFPTTEVYGDTPTAQLRMISCGGDLDVARHSYKGQVLVYAALDTLSPTGDLRPAR